MISCIMVEINVALRTGYSIDAHQIARLAPLAPPDARRASSVALLALYRDAKQLRVQKSQSTLHVTICVKLFRPGEECGLELNKFKPKSFENY